MHFVSDKSLQRPGYIYNEEGVGYPAGMTWEINWNHIDGPLMYHSDGGIHWLTWRERIAVWLRLTDLSTIDKRYRGSQRCLPPANQKTRCEECNLLKPCDDPECPNLP